VVIGYAYSFLYICHSNVFCRNDLKNATCKNATIFTLKPVDAIVCAIHDARLTDIFPILLARDASRVAALIYSDVACPYNVSILFDDDGKR
jgi:hypothetical protein